MISTLLALTSEEIWNKRSSIQWINLNCARIRFLWLGHEKSFVNQSLLQKWISTNFRGRWLVWFPRGERWLPEFRRSKADGHRGRTRHRRWRRAPPGHIGRERCSWKEMISFIFRFFAFKLAMIMICNVRNLFWKKKEPSIRSAEMCLTLITLISSTSTDSIQRSETKMLFHRNNSSKHHFYRPS